LTGPHSSSDPARVFERAGTRLHVQLVSSHRWFRFTGTATDAGLAACLEGAWLDAAYEFDRNELYDFTETLATELSVEGVRTVAELNRRLFSGQPARRSAILAGTRLVYAFGRVFEAHSDDRAPNVRLFQDRAAALAWLVPGQGCGSGTGC
jgi:hypothetical protein